MLPIRGCKTPKPELLMGPAGACQAVYVESRLSLCQAVRSVRLEQPQKSGGEAIS